VISNTVAKYCSDDLEFLQSVGFRCASESQASAVVRGWQFVLEVASIELVLDTVDVCDNPELTTELRMEKHKQNIHIRHQFHSRKRDDFESDWKQKFVMS
jgi:hypothetical protein